MKIFDCFLYHNEDIILDVRLNTMFAHIDKFIIVESRFDHQGNKKNLNFKIENFKTFQDKIIYLVIDEFPKNISNWERENYQRNYITKGLFEAKDDDYIIISDIDEIPDLTKLNDIENYKYTVFEQKMFYYKINLQNKTNPFWHGSRICKKKYLRTPQWIRNQKVKKFPFWKIYKIKWNVIKNGGWHFSFLMNAEQIKSKLAAYAHAEFNNENFNSLEKINYSINNKIDLFGRPINFEKIFFDTSFPDYIIKNKEKFKDWIL
jgi:beta-1,4-mannosyl-glycoprotein beta-1,4-N-acetylglucosaminyltransferase